MEKLITRKNLLILNIVFVVVFLLLSFKAVWPIVSGKGGGARRIPADGSTGLMKGRSSLSARNRRSTTS